MSWFIAWVARISAPVLAWAAIAMFGIVGALSAAVAFQTWRLGNAQDASARSDTLLELCRSENTQLGKALDEINAQAQRNIEQAHKAQERAEAAAQRERERRVERTQALESARKQLEEAMVGSECAAERVPIDVERLYRTRPISTGEDGN